ncbi:MAG TPA: hypothetical protein VGK37_14495 [Casimicrobiaceae bacterium]|jgi:hypothetical protein
MAVRPVRIATTVAAGAAAAVLAALAVAALINMRDAEISTQARSMARFVPAAIPADNNAYVALLGLTAPRRSDPLAEGRRLIAERASEAPADPFAGRRPTHPTGDPGPDEDEQITLVGDVDAGCDIFNEPCLPFARTREGAIRTLIANNQLLIDRYHGTQRMSGFAVVPIPDTGRLAIEWSVLGRVHALLLTGAALDAQQGRAAEACGFLRDDGEFWRQVLSGAATLGDKLSAFRALSEDARLGSEIIEAVSFDAGACGPPLRTLLTPLTGQQQSLADAYRMAFVPMLRMLASWPDPAVSVEPESWADRHLKETPVYELFYRRNASINRCAVVFDGLAALAAEPAPRFAAARDAFLAGNRDLTSVGPGSLYNPLGKTLLGRHLPLNVDYIAHAHGVAAYIKLVRTQLELRLARVPAADVAQFLETAAPVSTNPFDGRPFGWDRERLRISFDPIDRRWRRWGTSATVSSP